jgi:spore coat protein A
VAGPISFEGCREDAPTLASPEGAPPGEGGVCAATVASTAPPPVRAPLHPDALARYVDPLPIPATLAPSGVRPDPTRPGVSIPYYRVAMRETHVRVHRDLPPTRMWGYEGQVPGPTIEARRGAGVLVEWVNDLPSEHFLPIDHTLHGAHDDQPAVRTVVHVHGAKVAPESDGYPEAWYPPRGSSTGHYPLQQDAATLWYHDHAMGIERLNQYAGLFGAFVVRDDVEDALALPKGRHEVPLFLSDRLFGADGQLVYPTAGLDPAAPWVSEVRGDAILVNAALCPYLEVEPRRYRLRIVNASNSRSYILSFGGAAGDVAFQQIGSDQGLLAAPVTLASVTLASAERADLVVDFGPYAGSEIVLHGQTVPIMQFRVAAGARPREAPLPSRLRSVPRIDRASAVRTRRLTLVETRDERRRMRMLLDGKRWSDPVTEQPELDTVEIWELVNLTEDTHPIHLHLVRFQVVDRQGLDADKSRPSGTLVLDGAPIAPDPGELGWKDTVRVPPDAVTRIIARFEGYAGRYVWHCHVLEHAANEMMRPFEVVVRATP